MRFENRAQAGRVLAGHLQNYVGTPDMLVLGLPRGGLPVAAEVARGLHAPLDVFVVRKLGVPGHEELAMGAVASGGVRVINHDVVDALTISPRTIDIVTSAERQELSRRERLYRGDRPPVWVQGRTIILVDDGLATGATMRAGVEALKAQGPVAVVVAVPVGAGDTCSALGEVADDVVCVMTPHPFQAVGLWYRNFDQTTDDEVRDILRLAAQEQPPYGVRKSGVNRS